MFWLSLPLSACRIGFGTGTTKMFCVPLNKSMLGADAEVMLVDIYRQLCVCFLWCDDHINWDRQRNIEMPAALFYFHHFISSTLLSFRCRELPVHLRVPKSLPRLHLRLHLVWSYECSTFPKIHCSVQFKSCFFFFTTLMCTGVSSVSTCTFELIFVCLQEQKSSLLRKNTKTNICDFAHSSSVSLWWKPRTKLKERKNQDMPPSFPFMNWSYHLVFSLNLC